MKHLNIDIETYSDIDISKAGLYRYCDTPDFEVLLFAYAEDFGDVKIIDLAQGEQIPPEILAALKDKDVIKHAYNAAFEITCLNRAGYETPPEQWRCTMLHGMYLGYPAGLAKLGEALGLPEDKKKMGVGKALIRYFCVPCTPTKSNGNRTRNLPKHDSDRWNLFKEYCRQDVVTEIADYQRLRAFPVPDDVQADWVLDYEINSRGIAVDTELVNGALAIDDEHRNALTARAIEITGLSNPNSRAQLLAWLNENTTLDLPDLTKATVTANLNVDDAVAAEILDLRRELSKSSVSKYKAMATAVCSDGRVRGLLQYYGASRTGRWAGRLVQVQNLPRNYIENLDTARELVKKHNRQGLMLLYGNDVADTLSQLIRTAFIAPEGNILAVDDFSAIEARVLSWLAGEQWRMDVFAGHGKIYEAAASMMFGVPIDKISKGNPEYALRQKGKIAELALGYQGGPGALISMGAINMGLTEDELPDIVSRWRKANKRICDYWYSVEQAAVSVMKTAQPAGVGHGIIFAREIDVINGLDFLTVQLPSGRKLYYPSPYMAENKFGKTAIHYRTQAVNKWNSTSTYGGKLVENITQAIARDCLALAIRRLADAGYKPLMHIHDEVVCEVPAEKMHPDEEKHMTDVMCQPISWAPGLILNAAGFTNKYYMKD